MVTKQAQLDWLDKRRAAINEMIVVARQEDKGQHLPELQMVNAIAESVGEMTAVEYFEAKAAMCQQYIWGDSHRCLECPLVNCKVGEKYNPRRAVEIVKRWKEEQDGNIL